MIPKPPRPGEVALGFDPAARADVGVVFIGRLSTPWHADDCPKNLTEARARGLAPGAFVIEIDAPYRPGLDGLNAGDAVVVLYWMAGARRDLIVQVPRHRPVRRGTFALRSPARPNPIALATVRILAIDQAAGRLSIDAIDAHDGTPVVDLKPWIDAVDLAPGPA